MFAKLEKDKFETTLTDEQKQWILTLSGKDLYLKANELKKRNKIDNDTMRQMFAFWLNQRNIYHDEPYTEIRTVLPDRNGKTKFIEQNKGVPKLYWEKYNVEISVQTVKNWFQTVWNKSYSKTVDDINEIFN